MRLAHVLLAGTMVWRTYYTCVDQGAAQELLLPWPSMEYKRGADPLTTGPRPQVGTRPAGRSSSCGC